MAQTKPSLDLRIDVNAYLGAKAAGADLQTPLANEDAATHRKVIERAPLYATYAILSNNAYKRDRPLPMPPGWSENEDRRFDPGSGLAYAVFERHDANDKLLEAVVAFRGTDDLKDWVHNLDPFYGVQSGKAYAAFNGLRNTYTAQDVKVSATGHSLGGGLALEMALQFAGVEAVAFDSSPILRTGKPILENRRTSIWEAGEVLEPLRNEKSEWLVEWQGTALVAVDFEDGSKVRQHKIEPLARNLIKLAALYWEPFKQLERDLPG
jgi:hypothetical protein